MVGIRSAHIPHRSSTKRGRGSIGGVRANLRSGGVLALAVVAVVGGAGLITVDKGLIIVGFVAGAAIIALTVAFVVLRRWHEGNTRQETSYVQTEDVIRFRRTNMKP